MAAQSGVSERAYQGYEAGRSVPGGEALSGFVRLGINANWLLSGMGEMFVGPVRKMQAWDVDNRVESVGREYASQRAAGANLSPNYHLESGLVTRVASKIEEAAKGGGLAAGEDSSYLGARVALRLISEARGDAAALSRMLDEPGLIEAFLKLEIRLLKASR